MRHIHYIVISVALGVAALAPAARAARPVYRVERVIEISPVWAGHPVGFDLLTRGDRQYAAFYDAERRMTVAARRVREDAFRLVRLPERIGWDSHNGIRMAVDDGGYVHLSGNMHCVPLTYFRTARPRDIGTFERLDRMTGREERRVTYPHFFRGPEGELLFTYRDGGSGNGNQIYNVYDPETRTWSRLLDEPLTDGRGRMNAYLHGPVQGPGGRFHLAWVWRDTPDCATNHDPSYARSRDLRRWETVRGEAVDLPMTVETPGLIVDPVPSGGGIINGNVTLGFDAAGRPIVSYHKFDDEGKTQIYNARFEDGRWVIRRATDWDYRWAFGGGGSIEFEIRVGGVQAGPDGRLTQSYRHPKEGSGVWILDEKTLKPVGQAPRGPTVPKPLRRPESDFPGMAVRWRWSRGDAGETGLRYALRWETLGRHRDRPRKGPLPDPSMLRLYEFRLP
ncbi:MAG: BNR repeat-containing protein [Phycisphaerae bacterium]